MEERELCRNCKYFVKHYAGSNKVSFAFAENVCIKSIPVYVKERHYCGYWEERKEENEHGRTVYGTEGYGGR